MELALALFTPVRNDTNTRRVRRAKFRDKSYVRTFRFRSRRRYITCWTFLLGSYSTLVAGKKPTGQTAPARWTPTTLNDVLIQPALRYFPSPLGKGKNLHSFCCLKFQEHLNGQQRYRKSISCIIELFGQGQVQSFHKVFSVEINYKKLR